MIKLYGNARSRALRSIWAIEEVGVPYELVETNFTGDLQKPAYLAINPNARVPALVDGDLTLFESMAINLYLAKTYGGDLYPRTPQDEARAIQWSVWGMTEIEPQLMQLLLNRIMLPEDQRDPAAVKAAETAIERPLKVLDAHLAKRSCLLGDTFTITDLNVASVLFTIDMVGYDVSPYANVKRWLDATVARPSMARAQKAEGKS
jgi:glutathione S-transferase